MFSTNHAADKLKCIPLLWLMIIISSLHIPPKNVGPGVIAPSIFNTWHQ